MALSLKHWFAILAAGLALVSIWQLPPAAFEPNQAIMLTHEEARARALSHDLRVASSTLKRMRWADSLITLVVDNADDGMLVALPAEHGLSDEEVRQVREQAGRFEEEVVGPQRPDMKVGFVYQPLTHGSEPELATGERPRTETYAGTRNGKNYCFRVRASDTREFDAALRDALSDSESSMTQPDALGVCYLYAKHGLPGVDVTRWLESGATGFTLRQTARPVPRDTRFGRNGFFGRTFFGRNDELVQDGCVAGIVEACATVFLTPAQSDPRVARAAELAALSPALAVSDVRWAFLGQGSYMLADLEREFGSEQFFRFWSSELPVDQAFRAAFGMQAGEWVVSWVGTIMRVDKPGPGMPQKSSSSALLVIALCAGIAYAWHRRRQVV
jgi:hypothetical protein